MDTHSAGPSKLPELITAPGCTYSAAVKSLLSACGIQHGERQAPTATPRGVRSVCAETVYHLTPILRVGDHIIEDWRAIIRFIDERLCAQPTLSQLSVDVCARMFNDLETLDELFVAPLRKFFSLTDGKMSSDIIRSEILKSLQGNSQRISELYSEIQTSASKTSIKQTWFWAVKDSIYESSQKCETFSGLQPVLGQIFR